MANLQLQQPLGRAPDLSFSGRRILFIVNDPGFFLSHRKNIALAAAAMGAQITVASPDGSAVEEIRRLGFEHYPIAIDRWGFHPWNELRTIWQIFRCFSRTRPDLVHHVTIKPVIYGTAAATVARVPAVINAVPGLGQVFSAAGKKAALRRWFVRRMYLIASLNKRAIFIFQNPDDRQRFIAEKIVSLRNSVIVPGAGVALDIFTPQPERAGVPIVLFAGRLLRDKGIGEFVQAARLLKQRQINSRFIVVGEVVPGNPASISQLQLEEWQGDSAVEFWGLRTDMPEILGASHVVCLPSYYGEGIPKILIEAAAAGRPIVSTQMPGCREIVRHEINGLLVPPRDASALAGAIEKLLLNKEMRLEMGYRSRVLAEDGGFSESAVVERTLAVYERQFGPI